MVGLVQKLLFDLLESSAGADAPAHATGVLQLIAVGVTLLLKPCLGDAGQRLFARCHKPNQLLVCLRYSQRSGLPRPVAAIVCAA